LVGYTNAGKSTLMRALSGAQVLTEDLLFATLDPITRRIMLPSGRPILASDTVGFIQKLPTELVAAFRATLEELADADVLVHVLDITHPDAQHQYKTVEATLSSLGLMEKPQIVALNKLDVAASDEADLARVAASLSFAHPNDVPISAARNWGLDQLLGRIDSVIDETEGARAGRDVAAQAVADEEAPPRVVFLP